MIFIILLSFIGMSMQTECLNTNINVRVCDEVLDNYVFSGSEAVVLQIQRVIGTFRIDVRLMVELERIEIQYCIACGQVCENIETDQHIQIFVDGINVCNVS